MARLIVGLGNPGQEYKNTRHNAGFLALDKLASKHWQKSKNGLFLYLWMNSKTELIKPQTFMNESGNAVKYATVKHGTIASNVYVVHDDLDLTLGEYKIQKGVGPKDHKGVNSVEERLGTKDFWRVRIGVDNRQPENRISGEDYVLQNFSSEEKKILNGVIAEVVEKLTSEIKN